MFLFTEQSKEEILNGPKRATRRRGKQRLRVGSIQPCYTRRPYARGGSKPFARVRITRRDEESYPGQGCFDSAHEAVVEGFTDWFWFIEAWVGFYGPAALGEPCVRYEFELVEVL